MSVVRHIAADVLREATARRYMAVVFGLIALGQVTLALALDLDVVGGAIVTSRFFGNALGGTATAGAAASDQLRPVFAALTGATYHLGLIFGVLATADIAVKSLSPGRVELLLSLPVRRWELMLGTFTGVGLIALGGMLFAVTGFCAVLFWKAGFATYAPVAGALMSVFGFLVVYAVMLLATTLARSAALASAAGFLVYLLSVIADDREEVRSWFTAGWTRELAGWVVAPLPRVRTLGRLARAIGSDGLEALWTADAGAAILGAAAFGGACLALAIVRVERKDW